MSTFNRIIVTFGLSVVCATILVDARGQASSYEPAQPEAPPAEQARAPQERYLMLISGQLIKGILSETPTECLVEQRVGIMHFPKKRVESSFDSIREAYEYRRAQLPERDSDERMRLALWCLNLKLAAEARELLTSILEQNPKHPQAKAMLVSIDQAATRLARRERDPDVHQTKAETMSDGRPEAFDAAVLRNAQRGLRIRDLPVIFDLPLPLAIKRTDEFTSYVHPLLQVYCAKCHDAQYDGEFQLVPIKARADRTSNALRANLDATLRLIDPKNLSHSVLLSSTLRPHGTGARPRPIFPGSNDKAYQALAQWVNHLSAPKEGDESAHRDPSRDQAGNDEVFAVDQNRSSAARLNKRVGADTKLPSASGSIPRTGAAAVRQSPAEPQEFPIPFAISGVKPNPVFPRKASDLAAKRSAGTASVKASASGGSTAKPAIPPPDDDPEDLPDPPKGPRGNDKSSAPKQATKPVTIDPKLLERTLQYRNANRQNLN